MVSELVGYLSTLRDNLRLDRNAETEVLQELRGHVDDRLEELKKAGLSEEEANRRCIELLGSAKLLARQIYETYSRATWRQTLLASLPHFLFGIMFALNWWRVLCGSLFMLVLVVSILVYAWCRVKPRWLSSWLRYALLPVVASGLFLLWLPRSWAWLAILVYAVVGVCLLYCFTGRIKYRDWLYASLMLLPMPTIVAWFLVMEPSGSFPNYDVSWIDARALWKA